jgi:hypothetical protein
MLRKVDRKFKTGKVLSSKASVRLKSGEGTVTFTPGKLKAFRNVYEGCAGDDERVFEFEGKHYLKGYAKYMIEFLEALWIKDDKPDRVES